MVDIINNYQLSGSFMIMINYLFLSLRVKYYSNNCKPHFTEISNKSGPSKTKEEHTAVLEIFVCIRMV